MLFGTNISTQHLHISWPWSKNPIRGESPWPRTRDCESMAAYSGSSPLRLAYWTFPPTEWKVATWQRKPISAWTNTKPGVRIPFPGSGEVREGKSSSHFVYIYAPFATSLIAPWHHHHVQPRRIRVYQTILIRLSNDAGFSNSKITSLSVPSPMDWVQIRERRRGLVIIS